MNKGMAMAAFFCVVLLVSSVTAVPVAAVVNVESHVKEVQDKYADELESLTHDGTPLDLARLSNLSVFRDAHIAGIDVTISTPGAATTAVSAGLFSLHTAAALPEQSTGLLPDLPNVPDDADVQYFVRNVTKVGYQYTGASTSTVVSKIKVADKTAMTPMQIAKAGLRWSDDAPNTLVGQTRLTNYTYAYPSTGSQVEVQVIQLTTPDGAPTGDPVVALSPVTVKDETTVEWRRVGEVLGYSGVVGAVTGLTAYVFFGASTAAEATGLLTGTAVGLSVAASAAIGVCVFLALLLICFVVWYFWFYDTGPTAYFATYPDDVTTRSAVHNADGAIVYADGTVSFLVDPVPPPLPETGGPWVQATRTAAINNRGELWVLINDRWTRYASAYVYTDLKASGSWFATVATDESGKSHLEIPMVGSAQPQRDSPIQRDVALLNAGIDPKTNKPISPAVPGWKEFVPGVETSWYGPYGLALATDGRVFGVGSNRDGQCDLPGRYTKVGTANNVGWFSASPYSIGIRIDDGGLDFAGDNWFSIKNDIANAGLTNVRDIAAGPDRAIAITESGGVRVFGATNGWHNQYSGPSNTPNGTYRTISSALPTDDGNIGVYIATTGRVRPGIARNITRTPTSFMATTALATPFTASELDLWRTDVMAKSPPPLDGGRVIGIPKQDSTMDPIVAYGIRHDETSGLIEQFVGRAAGESDVAPVQAMLAEWSNGPAAFDAYLDRTYPFDPDYARQHFAAMHAVTHEPDTMTTVWSATTVSSAAPTGMLVGHYSLDQLIANKNWTIYALETDGMPIPGVQAFSSGYITHQADVRHQWTGNFAKYDSIYNTPYESTTGPTTIYGSVALSENSDYHYMYSQSPASLTYQAGFIPGGAFVPTKRTGANAVAWSLGYTATDPAGYRGTFNPASIVAAKKPSPPRVSTLALASIESTATFTRAGVTAESGVPHDAMRIYVVGGATS